MVKNTAMNQLPSGYASFIPDFGRRVGDGPLFVLLLGIAGFGLVVLYSAVQGDFNVFINHVIRTGLAFLVLIVAAQFVPRLYIRWIPIIYAVSVLLLVVVIFFGISVKGSQRWLDLPLLPRFQPSEVMKIAIPLMLAWYLGKREYPLNFLELCICVLIIGVPVVLIMLQPDLGTSMLLVILGCGMLVFAGINWRWIVGAVAGLIPLLPLAWIYLLHEYQKERLLTLFYPDREPLGAGWSIAQSKIAVGSGGLLGKGAFHGTQSQLDFLPEGHTDFILAVIAEEFGFVVTALLLIVYFGIFARGLYIATQAKDRFGQLAVSGLILIFFTYVVVNVGMVLGIFPVVGVPLPLISYGGTSALTLMGGLGIVMAVHKNRGW